MVFSVLPGFVTKVVVVPPVCDSGLCHGADNENSNDTVSSRKVTLRCLGKETQEIVPV